jgi:hypothetical protein
MCVVLFEVRYVDLHSPTFARNKRCDFWLRGTNRGTLDSPQHSLPRNTTCLYYLQGVDDSINAGKFPGLSRITPPTHQYVVWVSILKFHVSSTFGRQLGEEEGCASQLKVWNGAFKSTQGSTNCNDIFWYVYDSTISSLYRKPRSRD